MRRRARRGMEAVTGLSDYERMVGTYDGGRPVSGAPKGHSMKGELIAWREWRLMEGKLLSVVHGYTWDGPHVKTEIAKERRADPTGGPYLTLASWAGGASQETGFWFVKRRRQIINESSYGGSVIGACALYGHVIEHERGYRTSEAMIRYLEIQESAATPEIVKQLERRYACTVRPVKWERKNQDYGLITISNPLSAYSYQNGVYAITVNGSAQGWTSVASSESSTSPAPTPSLNEPLTPSRSSPLASLRKWMGL